MPISVRRYQPPLESCVLITATEGDRPWRLLTGCGLAWGVSSDQALVRKAVAALIKDLVAGAEPLVIALPHTGRTIAAGFAVPGWDAVAVAEVWLPASEAPTAAAQAARAAISGAASRQAAMLELLAARAATNAARAIVDSCVRDDPAMETVWHGVGGDPPVRILDADAPTLIMADGAQVTIDKAVAAGPVAPRVVDLGGRADTIQLPPGSMLDLPTGPLFDQRFVETQRKFIGRNRRATPYNQMDLRTLGKVGAVSRLQPLALALDLQLRHHLSGFAAVVDAGPDRVLLLGDRSLPASARRDRAPDRPQVDHDVTILAAATAVPVPRAGFAALEIIADARSLTSLPHASRAWHRTDDSRWTELTA